MAATAGRFGKPATQPAGGDQLVFRSVTLEDLSDFKERRVGKPAISIALRGHDQAWDQAWPHVGKFCRNRIGDRQFGLGAAKKLGLPLRHERPGYAFDHPACGKSTLGLARAILNYGEYGLARVLACEWRRRYVIDSNDAHNLFDDIGASMNVRAPGWHRHFHPLPLAGGEKTEFFQHPSYIDERQFKAGEALQLT